ncbi:MAG: diaminopimelate decarboxylase [Tannerella sp.]|jgi:diaminopimelate decarboxylase|nr:diaminopimelate decarboxylase [Tannerella sp.]
MSKGIFPVEKFRRLQTPFYYYDMALLQDTLNAIRTETGRYGYHQHYAVKANANPKILALIAKNGLGADCVSGGEVQAALDAGFPASKIVFAGVGKTDREINLGLDREIACFNAESLEELEVINALAEAKDKTATVALRINPDVDAHTHAKITTGLQENKFGINPGRRLEEVIRELPKMNRVRFSGIHFHIGSQITDLSVFQNLCIRANELQDELEARGLRIENLNFGGGLGIDYRHPNLRPVPGFDSYFAVFHQFVKRREGQRIHFELGRSVVGQCGALISKVLYVKKGEAKQFAILDAGFTDLIRPAMYDAYHHPENITGDGPFETYDIAGPICESSDVFNRDVELNRVCRNDLIAFRSAGAYGEIMASQYNCRALPESYFSNEI